MKGCSKRRSTRYSNEPEPEMKKTRSQTSKSAVEDKMDSANGLMFGLDDMPEVTPKFAVGDDSNDGMENGLNGVSNGTNGTYGANGVEKEDSLSELDAGKFKLPFAKPSRPVFRR